ncbi:2-C-methyl-D-erythritol 2,4-cyclodiphosphate synthase [Bifidobacterium apri]|uniref:2-C-methyl-D-erythritol 2,4-cyclodiphosphate synthase n=2 Tax=Bifidobacterium apri TaxID=1769423 RepID=A0A6A2VEW7_9BIFI|nr:2-C-methyl-D-erythritol 2,4-cyclodiphosphate synthase [Bifidobacterium apri]
MSATHEAPAGQMPNVPRVGIGFDAHRFAQDSRPLWLACLEWEGIGIEGDSDGDVAAHALIDALLSAAGLGDIGMLFGVGADSAGAGAHGFDMLQTTRDTLRKHGFMALNASVVVIGNRPKMSAKRRQAEQMMSHAAGCPVSITATTTDGMGFTGAGEGLAAMATAMVVECDGAASLS